jgi:CheY-like chemotaxis protein
MDLTIATRVGGIPESVRHEETGLLAGTLHTRISTFCTSASLLYREASFMTKTVLIIDDDAPTRGLLKAVVIRAGLEALVASNGGEAIDIINTRDDLRCIVLDLMMPVIDGGAVIDHLSSTGRNVPVIVCTAVGPRLTPEFDRSIVRAVIQKPFDVEQLAAMLKAFSE